MGIPVIGPELNLKTPKVLALAIPSPLFDRADEVMSQKARGQMLLGGMAAGRHCFEATRKGSWGLAPLIAQIRTSIAKNAAQISPPVGAEVFSVSRENLEKYGSRTATKHRDFSNIENPYQIPVVQRSREKPSGEPAWGALLDGEGAELCCKKPAKRGDFRPVRSRERKLAMTRLAAEMRFGLAVRSRFPRSL
jgi:hypothetical protein